MSGRIFVSDARARLKPCLRCGYSLAHIHEARNCPECGLAVRVSLGGNRGLEWANPDWLKWLGVATAVLAAAHLLMPLHWGMIEWLGRHAGDWSPAARILAGFVVPLVWPALLVGCGVGMCLVSRGERRYPDDAWFVRWIVIGMGIGQLALAGAAVYFLWGTWMAGSASVPPYWVYWTSSFARGFWPLWIGDMAVLVVVGAFGIRGKWRKNSEYFTTVVIIWWLCCFGRLACYLPIGETWFGLVFDFAWKCVYGSLLCVWLSWASRNFWRHRREAMANWVSD